MRHMKKILDLPNTISRSLGALSFSSSLSPSVSLSHSLFLSLPLPLLLLADSLSCSRNVSFFNPCLSTSPVILLLLLPLLLLSQIFFLSKESLKQYWRDREKSIGGLE